MPNVEVSNVYRLMRGFTVFLGVAAALPSIGSGQTPRLPLTVARAIETTRAMGTLDRFGSELSTRKVRNVLVSPDGLKYATLLARGDVERNGVWMTLIVGGLRSLADAAHYRTVAKLFTGGEGSRGALTFRFDYRIKWLQGSQRIALMAEDPNGVTQVATVDVESGAVKFLTDLPGGIELFDMTDSGDLIVATAKTPSRREAEEIIANGFVVTDTTARGLLTGFPNGTGLTAYDFIVAGESGTRPLTPVTLDGPSAAHQLRPQITSLSPDGRFAMVDVSPSPNSIPDAWGNYADPYVSLMAREAHTPGGGRSWVIQRLYVVDMAGAVARPLWAAPKPLTSNVIVWSPDSKAVLLGPTFLPPSDSSPAGQAGTAIAVVDILSGNYTQINVPASLGSRFHGSRWLKPGIVELENKDTRITFQMTGGNWRLRSVAAIADDSRKTQRIEVIVREDMHTPPRLVARDSATGREREIVDFNPHLLERYSLGRVESFTWQDDDTRTWHGRLYYPVGYTPGRAYPLVLQTHGVAPPSQFSLYGIGDSAAEFPGLGPPGASVDEAQVLANRGIFVLQVEDKEGKDREDFILTPLEPKVYSAAYEAAISALKRAGLVAGDRVGISGFSRSGWYVEYALTHSTFPYAAALVSDNFDAGYLQACLGGSEDGLTREYAQDNGAPGIGDGLKTWLENTPAFNAPRVHAPLRIQVESGGLVNVVMQWEMFNALRLLAKPVEFYVVPNIERGSHNLQNPRQILASAESTVDWFDFWLNGREDSAPEKVEQYARWHTLKELREGSTSLPDAKLRRLAR
jgi:hypothetical protein